MTSNEFRLEFDTIFDNITNGAAPGLDDYDRSYFLSKAQDELVKSIYDDSFEKNEKSRRRLDTLVSFYTTSTEVVTTDVMNSESQVFEIPADVQYIVAENAVTDGEVDIDVKPKTHDEFRVILRNPFQKPSVNNIEKFAIRLDRANVTTQRVVELLIFDDDIADYNIRYVAKPTPIILSDLTQLGVGISIEGETDETLCALDSFFHREIIDRAAELALENLEQSRLQTKIQLNQRNK